MHTRLLWRSRYKDRIPIKDLQECRHKRIHELRILCTLTIAFDAVPDLNHKLLFRPKICALSAFRTSCNGDTYSSVRSVCCCRTRTWVVQLRGHSLEVGCRHNEGVRSAQLLVPLCRWPPTRSIRLLLSSCVFTGDVLQALHWLRGFVRNAPGYLHLTAGKCRNLFMLRSN